MKTTFKPTDCSKAIIAGLYPELSLHSKINAKGIILPSLACRVTPGITLFLSNKYRSRNDRGEVKSLRRQVEKMRKSH